MSKARVPLWSKPLSFVTIDTDATKGATVGRDLFWPNGKVVTESELRGNGAGTPPATDVVTYWRLIQEVPANVSALASATGTGIYVLRGPGVSATRTIESDTLDVVNGDGVVGNPTINLAPLRLPAGEAIHGRRVVRVDGGEVFHPLLADAAHAMQCIGIALQAAATGGVTEIRQSGQVTEAGWSWSPGPVFCDDAGVLTQTPPASGWQLVVGRAVTPDTLDIDFKIPLIRSN